MKETIELKKDNQVRKVKKGFDYNTFALAACGLAFLPSLIRKEYLTALKLLVIQYSFLLFALPLQLKLISVGFMEIIMLLVMIYIAVFCWLNNEMRIKKYIKKGFKII